MMEGTKMCTFCHEEITDSLYYKIKDRPFEKWYQTRNIIIGVLGIIVTLLITILTQFDLSVLFYKK
jgi:hypothetical protein